MNIKQIIEGYYDYLIRKARLFNGIDNVFAVNKSEIQKYMANCPISFVLTESENLLTLLDKIFEVFLI